MVATLIDCSSIASNYEDKLKDMYVGLENKLGFATIITGPPTIERDGVIIDTPQKPSWKYAQMLGRDCDAHGIKYQIIECSTDDALRIEVKKLNEYSSIDGILILSPHPPRITVDRHNLANMVIVDKDVEGLSNYHKGKLEQKYEQLQIVPPTAGAVMAILNKYGYEYKNQGSGKNALIINRSEVLGKPLRNLLEHKGMTVTAVDVNTSQEYVKYLLHKTDLVVTAVPLMPQAPYKLPVDDVQEGAIVIAVESSNIGNTKEYPYHDILMEKCSLVTDKKDPLGKITCKITLMNLYNLAVKP